MNRISPGPVSMKYRNLSNCGGDNRTSCPSFGCVANQSHVADSVGREAQINLLRAIATNDVVSETSTSTIQATPPVQRRSLIRPPHAPEGNIVIKPGTVAPRPATALACGTTSRKRREGPRP